MNKTYKEYVEEIVCCMVEGVGIIIGKVKNKNFDYPVLDTPRVVQTTQTDEKMPPQVRLGKMFGTPDELVMIRPPVFMYKLKHKGVFELYKKETTGLVIPINPS